jgi:hypothetical protein
MTDAVPEPNPTNRPPEPTQIPGPIEVTLSQDGKVLYHFQADNAVFFDDEAITDPAELARLRRPSA